ncbi:MAG: TonB-dependent receptor [Deltaproteobacteria bacterium]|nr:TonB-dependent receptor [Deltaproteobacteria bacterium]
MPCLYGVATVSIDSHITGVTVLFSTVNRERLHFFLPLYHRKNSFTTLLAKKTTISLFINTRLKLFNIKVYTLSLFFLIATAFICEANLSTIEDEMQVLRMFYQEKELVISATRHPKPVSQVAENITVITAKEIERMNAHTISEVLNRVPGIFLRGFNHDFGSPALMTIQGSNERNIRVLLDGITWNQLTNNSPETISIPVGIVKRIEIIKGPASSAWGSSLGGVVNIITKSAGDTKIPSGTVQASFGERDTRDYRAEVSGLAGPVGCYLFGARQKSDGLRDSRHFDNNSFFSKFRIPVSKKINAIISMGYTEPETDFGENFSGKVNTRTFHSKALIEARLNDNLDFSIAAYHFKQKSVLSSHNTESRYKYDDQTTGGNATIAWSNQYHTAVLGFDFDHGELGQTEKRSVSQTSKTDPDIKKWALYANDTIIIKNLSIIPGFRYDYNSLTGSFLSPSIGATYQIGKESILRGSVARGFTIPPLPYVSGGGIGYEQNRSLDSEEIWSYQGGFETAAAKYLWIKTTYFFHNLHKKLRPPTIGQPRFTNHGKTRRQGIEIEVQTIPFYNFTCFAGFSYAHIDSSEKSCSPNIYTYDFSIKYDDKKTFYAELFGHYTWWNIEDRASLDSHYNTFIWDLNITKKLDFKTKVSSEIFFTAHNIFNGSQYVDLDMQNPQRWVEAGLRIHF